MGLAFHRERHEKTAEATPAPVAAPEPEPEPVADEPSVEGHTVECERGWYRLLAPDGEQVGKAKRTEAEAWAILEEGS